MANIDQLLRRNKDFAATAAHEEASIIARHQVYVITCLDPRTDLAREAVTDPEQTVRCDVELLRSATVLPDTITVSGHVYDVTTGLVTTIIPAAPMHRMSSLSPNSA